MKQTITETTTREVEIETPLYAKVKFPIAYYFLSDDLLEEIHFYSNQGFIYMQDNPDSDDMAKVLKYERCTESDWLEAKRLLKEKVNNI